jgi:hypothetical protein
MNTPTQRSRFRVARVSASALLVALLAAPTLASSAAARPSAPAAANLPCIPAGHGPGDKPSISFGRSGGNIRPMRVKIYGDGTITYTGITPSVAHYTIAPEAVLGLQRLADAEGFSTMPALIKGAHFLPDSATLSITIRAGCSTTTKTVKAHGAHLGGFTELYDTLSAATALGLG